MLIIDYLKPNESLDERYCRGSPTCYAFTNDCKKIPLDEDGNLQYDKAIDISEDEKLKENLRKRYFDRVNSSPEQFEEEMAMVRRSWLLDEIGI